MTHAFHSAHLNYIWEWSINYGSLSVMFTPLHSGTNHELFEKYVCNLSNHTMVLHNPVIVWNWSIYFPSLSAMFNTCCTAIQINNCLKSTKIAAMKNTDDLLGTISVSLRKPSRATSELILYTVSKYEWNTKEDSGKSLKNTFNVSQYAKRHLSGWSDAKQWKNQARSPSHYLVTLVWRHQLVG